MATTNRTMFCWGNVAAGQLGLGGIEDDQIFTPHELVAFRGRRVKNIACGVEHTLFVMEDGAVYSCGNNDYGQLGHEKTRRKPEQIDALQTQFIQQVGCGLHHSVALNERGQLFTWGDNSFGQLGWQTSEDSLSRSPKLVKHLTSHVVIQVACGYHHNLVLTSDSLIFSWGSNEKGQLGHSFDSKHLDHPKCIQSLVGLAIGQVAAGGYHSFCLTVSRALFGWGFNRYGQLGVGNTSEEGNLGPRLCKMLRSQKAKSVVCGENHTVVLTENGGVFTWGAGMYGQLGHNGLHHETNPRKVFELMGNEVTMVACGRSHTVAYVLPSGKLFSFGLGGNGQLGIGSKQNHQVPSLIQFDPSCSLKTGSHVVYFIAAGGDQCFVSTVSAKSGTQPRKFRFGMIDQEISRVTNERLDQLSLASPKEKPSQDLSSDIERVFTSLGCMNGSFLMPDEGHFDCGPKNHGVSIELARKAFTRINNLSNKYIKDLIERLISQLVSSLPSHAPDYEALRFYLTLPCSWYFDSPFNQSLVCAFGKAVFLLEKNAGKVIDMWWSQLGQEYLMRMIQSFKQIITNILKSEGLVDGSAGVHRRQNVYVCLEILSKLKAVNDYSGYIVPYESFYILELHEMVDLQIDYVAWLQQTGQIRQSMEENPFVLPLPVKLQGALWAFCHYPFIFDGQSKTLLLKVDAHIQMTVAMGGAYLTSMLLQTPEIPVLLLCVTRENIVRNTIDQLSKYSDLELKKPLRVIFTNEEALDAGGVRKEFFMLLLRDLLDPKYGMFEYYEESRLFWFCTQTFESTENYQLIGVVCGLAIYNSTIIDLSLPLAIFKKLLKKPVTLDDMKQLKPTVGRSLQALLDYEGDDFESTFGLTFEVSHEVYGVVLTTELEPGGSVKSVTQENKKDYVMRLIEYTFTTSIRDQFDAFCLGFHKVCGGRILDLFQPEELQAMVVGNENYDWHQLEQYTEYKGDYTKDHPTIRFFWEVFHDFPLEDKKKFLLFLTGCDRIPILGMKALKLIIQPMKVDTNYLPVAHTCFNLLDLPPYHDKEMLRRKLLRAIENAQGFGLV